MALTYLNRYKKNIKEIIRYVSDKKKTNDLYYEMDLGEKSVFEIPDEKELKDVLLLFGVNCDPYGNVAEQMTSLRESLRKIYNNRVSVTAFHGYQTFKPNEVTPYQAQMIGIELANRCWGDRHQVLVATHCNSNRNVHNHFVVNPWSFVDGKRISDRLGEYLKMTRISDEICKIYNITTSEIGPLNMKNKKITGLISDGIPTAYNAITEAIDIAEKQSRDFSELRTNLIYLGIDTDDDNHIHHLGSGVWTNFRRLGKKYSRFAIEERINERMKDREEPEGFEFPPEDSIDGIFEGLPENREELTIPQAMRVYCRAIRQCLDRPENNIRMDIMLKRDEGYLDEFYSQIHMMENLGIKTRDDLDNIIPDLKSTVGKLSDERKKVRCSIKRKAARQDPGLMQELKEERNRLTESMNWYRNMIRYCEKRIPESLPRIEKNLGMIHDLQYPSISIGSIEHGKEVNEHERIIGDGGPSR